MEEIQKPSKGQELLNRIKEGELFNKDSIVDLNDIPIGNPIEKEDVEVIKGEIVSFSELEKNKPLPVDRFGLPIPKNRKTWDRI